MGLEETYRLVKSHIPQNQQIDSLNVVEQVEQYRQWWKPSKATVFLLGESHIATSEEDSKLECNRQDQNKLIPNYPTRYVRAIYCLGYGESDILNRNAGNNSGTFQFWQIFSSCIAKDCNSLGFEKILKGDTPNFFERLRNKVSILKEMQRRGIWLMDASIIGIYGNEENHGWKMDKDLKNRIIISCWDAYILNQIVESQPKHIIVIGKGVEKILKNSLDSLRIPYTSLPQPQGNRGDRQQQLETYREYQRICSRYCQ